MFVVGVRYSKGEAERAIATSHCWTEALRKLGMCPTGGGAATLKKWARRWNLSTDHFDPNLGRVLWGRGRRVPLEEILVEHSSFSRGHLKKRLYDEGLKDPRCELCGQGDLWRGRPMALILDHTNGIRDDHRLANLRIVCPNCAATLDTHCGRNLPREYLCETCGKPFAPRTADRRFCSLRCVNVGRFVGVAHPERRKVPRPSAAQLAKDLKTMSCCAVGRKYGVSDNAIRKWLKWYERERERQEAEAA